MASVPRSSDDESNDPGPLHLPEPGQASGASARELPEVVSAKVGVLRERAAALVEQQVYDEPVPVLIQALTIIPEPRAAHGGAAELYGLLADCFYRSILLEEARAAACAAVSCVDGEDDAVAWAVLGQSLLDTGRGDEATEPLRRAYALDREVFDGEVGEVRYLNHLRERQLV